MAHGLRQRPTYEELVDLIERDPDKIRYPNRSATFLRNSFELSFLDSYGHEELLQQQMNLQRHQIALQQIQQTAAENQTSVMREAAVATPARPTPNAPNLASRPPARNPDPSGVGVGVAQPSIWEALNAWREMMSLFGGGFASAAIAGNDAIDSWTSRHSASAAAGAASSSSGADDPTMRWYVTPEPHTVRHRAPKRGEPDVSEREPNHPSQKARASWQQEGHDRWRKNPGLAAQDLAEVEKGNTRLTGVVQHMAGLAGFGN